MYKILQIISDQLPERYIIKKYAFATEYKYKHDYLVYENTGLTQVVVLAITYRDDGFIHVLNSQAQIEITFDLNKEDLTNVIIFINQKIRIRQESMSLNKRAVKNAKKNNHA